MEVSGASIRWGEARRTYRDFHSVLREEERTYVSRHRRREDMLRSAAGIALLRMTAAELTGAHPAQVPLRRWCRSCGGTDHGQPWLGDHMCGSISHAGDMIAVAVHPEARVGIDLEVAGRSVSPDLARTLVDPHDPGAASADADPLRLWVRKEAVLKATGEGLGTSPHHVWVSPARAPAALLRHSLLPGLRCALWDVTVIPGTVAALAVVAP